MGSARFESRFFRTKHWNSWKSTLESRTLSLWLNSDDAAETNSIIAAGGNKMVAVRRKQSYWIDSIPGSATQHPAARFPIVEVLAPFPNIAAEVVKSVGVRSKTSDR